MGIQKSYNTRKQQSLSINNKYEKHTPSNSYIKYGYIKTSLREAETTHHECK